MNTTQIIWWISQQRQRRNKMRYSNGNPNDPDKFGVGILVAGIVVQLVVIFFLLYLLR